MGLIPHSEHALATPNGSVFGRFLAVTEAWESRSEKLSDEAQKLTLDACGLTFIVGVLSLGIAALLRHSDLASFFWIDSLGHLEHTLISFGFWLSIALIAVGAIGFLLWWVCFERETGPATRYFVVGEVAVLGLSLTGEAFVLFFLVLQLVLWIVVAALAIAACIALLVGALSALGS